MFSKIVVGLDGSEPSNTALRVACDLVQKYGSDLYLIHTPQPQTVAFAMGAMSGYHAVTTMPAPAEVESAGRKILEAAEQIVSECGASVTQSALGHGDPADEIIKCAKDCGGDLIVTGRRGLGALGALVQGSTTQRVNHYAECACLSVA